MSELEKEPQQPKPFHILKTAERVHIFLYDVIDVPAVYYPVYEELVNPSAPTIELHISTDGGMTETGVIICNYIENCTADVVGNVTGQASSIGVNIALTCDHLEIDDDSEWLLHSSSGGGGGRSSRSDRESLDRICNTFERMTQRLYSRIMSAKEIKGLLKDTEFWFDGKEIKERLKKYDA